jgi:hypothetical protein
MSQTVPPHSFVYVHTDIPGGMTIDEWRARRAAKRIAINTAAREQRRRRRAAAIRRWLVAPAAVICRPRLRGRETNG